MKNIKSEKGAISLFVILAMLFFLAFMLGIYSMTSRRNASQLEAVRETSKVYASGVDSGTAYDSLLSVSDGSLVPIVTVDHLKMLKDVTESETSKEANVTINGKLYTYKKYQPPAEDANKKNITYILNNDIIIDMKSEEDGIDGKSDITIYDYMLYDKTKYNINMNNHNIYYRLDDDTLWKCIFYHNTSKTGLISDGSASDRDNFFSKTDDTKTPIKSFEPRLYSSMSSELAKLDKAGFYEFLLIYNCGQDKKFNITNKVYQRWKQSGNPINLNNTHREWYVPEYIPVDRGLSGVDNKNYWGGLSLSTDSKVHFDGSPIDVSSNYVLGAYETTGTYGMNISDFTNTYKPETSASQCLLFVRADVTRPTYDATIIPISTAEQLESIRTVTEDGIEEKKHIINGEEYTFVSRAKNSELVYKMTNDIILDMAGNLDNNSTVKIYDYMLYDKAKYNIDQNGHDIYYRLPGTECLYKCVFYQDIGTSAGSANLFSTKDEAKNSLLPKKYSILGTGIKDEYKQGGKFEFVLAYSNKEGGVPNLFNFGGGLYQRWKQETNPTVTADTGTKVQGYEAITTGLGTGNHWGGLVQSSSGSTLLDGSVGHKNWFFSIGTINFYSDRGIPTSSASGESARQSTLFVRIK